MDHHDARPWHQHHDGGAAARAAVAAEPLSALQRHRLATILWMERDETPAVEFAGLGVSGLSLYPTTGLHKATKLVDGVVP